MTEKVVVIWEVEDGYAGGSRPHRFRLDLVDMVQSCETEQEAENYIETDTRADFENRVSFHVRNHEEVMQAWRDLKAESKADG